MRPTDIDRRVKKLVASEETRNPFVLCERLGVYISFSYLRDMRGYCLREDGQAFIVIAGDLNDCVSEFVCAHELGHLVLHKNTNRLFMDKKTIMVTSKFEKEADRFACQLLYSEPPLFEETTLTDIQIAECLMVPTDNVNAKMTEYGIFR